MEISWNFVSPKKWEPWSDSTLSHSGMFDKSDFLNLNYSFFKLNVRVGASKIFFSIWMDLCESLWG